VRRGIIPDTEGAGTFRGAPSIYGEFGPIEGCTMKVLYTADGTINSAMGARRGGRGALAQAQKRGRDGSLTALPACYGVALEPGEFVVSHSAGGGGYGPPFERDPGRVLHDLREGWITAVRARSVYGVVTTGDAADDTLAVDAAATQSLRSQMRAAASGPDLTSEA
jgi:N-methylhydantoinase B